jgi:hypothetical protein
VIRKISWASTGLPTCLGVLRCFLRDVPFQTFGKEPKLKTLCNFQFLSQQGVPHFLPHFGHRIVGGHMLFNVSCMLCYFLSRYSLRVPLPQNLGPLSNYLRTIDSAAALRCNPPAGFIITMPRHQPRCRFETATLRTREHNGVAGQSRSLQTPQRVAVHLPGSQRLGQRHPK